MYRLLAAVSFALACCSSWAQAPQPPEVAAASYLLLDMTAGQVLAEREADKPSEPASLTKLMTAYIVFDALRAKKIEPQQLLAVSERAWKMPGPRMYVDPKSKVAVDDLLKGLIVQSGNDAAMALAEGVAGSAERFVELMNQQASAIGLKGTAYRNVEGLPAAGQATTARDLAVLSARLISEFPEYVGTFALRKYRYEGAPTADDTNPNRLLFLDPTVDGLGTGRAAGGYGLVATARRDFPNVRGRRLVAVVLGASSEEGRAAEAQKLLNWGYTAWEGLKLFDANQAVVEPGIWKGTQKTVKLGQPQPIVLAVPSGTGSQLRTQVTRRDPLVAPVKKGQQGGTLKILRGGQVIREIPLVALSTVEEAGIFSRMWDAIRLWIK